MTARFFKDAQRAVTDRAYKNSRGRRNWEDLKMDRTGKFIALVLALGSGPVGLPPNNNGGDGTDERPLQKADQNQMNPQPREKVQQGGRIVWPSSSVPANFNYGQLDGTTLDGAQMLNAVMPILYFFDASATPRHNPDYLVGEPILATSPKQVVTYRLNPKAIWYDGTPIAAPDFIAQWKAHEWHELCFSNFFQHRIRTRSKAWLRARTNLRSW